MAVTITDFRASIGFPDRRPSMNQSRPESVVIVGGGITGLATAWKIKSIAPKTRVTILEGSDRFGGVLQTKQIGSYLVETAADMFTSQPATALVLCKALGIEDSLLTTNEPEHKAFVGLGEKVVPVPAGFSLMVPSSDEPIRNWPLLTELGKERLLDEINIAARDYDSDVTDEDFASFAIRRFGQEAFDVLIQPLVSGIYSADPTKLSMNATMQRFVAMEKNHGSLIQAVRQKADSESTSDSRASGARYNLFRTPHDGFGGLVKALIASMPDVEIKSGMKVDQVFRADHGGWKVHCGDESEFVTDGLVVATPADVAAKILPHDEQFRLLKEDLSGIESTSCAIVAMGIDRSALPNDFRGFGIIYPHIDQGSMIAISFASNKFAGRAPDGKMLLRFFIGGAMQEALVDLPDEALIEISMKQFQRSMGCRPATDFQQVFRWKNAMPQYFVGHVDRVDRIDSSVAQIEGLELAGKSYRGVGIPACVESGFNAAERLIGNRN